MLKSSLLQNEDIRQVNAFDQIKINGYFAIRLVRSDAPYVKVKGQANDSEVIYTEVKNRQLLIGCPKLKSTSSLKEKAELEIGYQALTRIDLNGVVDLTTEDVLEFDSLTFIMDGVSNVDVKLKGQSMVAELNGPVSVTLEGEVDKAKIVMPGAGVVDADDLRVNDVYFAMLGAGKADVFASKELKVKISGAGIVRYHGQPECVSSNIGGIGRLTKVN